MNREETLKEIDEAMAELRNVKTKVNQTLSHARNIVAREVSEKDKTYIDGLNDAWELARKIGKMPCEVGTDIFGYNYVWEAIENHTPQEALQKLEAYEKEQAIKVGDVVLCTETKGTAVVAKKPTDNEIYILWNDGSTGRHNIEGFKKTGKHIDISSILEQIKE